MTFFSQKIDNFQNFWRKKYAFFQQNLSIRVKVKYWSLEVGDLLSVLFLWLHLIAAWKLCPKNFWRKKNQIFYFQMPFFQKSDFLMIMRFGEIFIRKIGNFSCCVEPTFVSFRSYSYAKPPTQITWRRKISGHAISTQTT